MQPASHPRSCQVCEGTGWQPAEPVKFKANGAEFEYSMLEPCTHHWANDDPDVDEWGYNRTIPVSYQRGRRIAAQAYVDECARQGRQPDWELFTALIADFDA